MTKGQLKKIIEQELLKEFGGKAGGLAAAAAEGVKDYEDDMPDYTNLKKYEEDKKKDCFDEDDFKSKAQCVKNTQKVSEKAASAIVAKVLRDKGEIK